MNHPFCDPAAPLPANYVCTRCKTDNVKLWRNNNGGALPLYCTGCALAVAGFRTPVEGDQNSLSIAGSKVFKNELPHISVLTPAIPTEYEKPFWMAPCEAGIAQWWELPLGRSPTALPRKLLSECAPDQFVVQEMVGGWKPVRADEMEPGAYRAARLSLPKADAKDVIASIVEQCDADEPDEIWAKIGDAWIEDLQKALSNVCALITRYTEDYFEVVVPASPFNTRGPRAACGEVDDDHEIAFF